MSDLTIRPEETPNPNARRYIVNRAVQDEPKGRFFKSPGGDPMADALFTVDGVTGVMLLPGSVTVNKDNESAWDAIDPRVLEVLERSLA